MSGTIDPGVVPDLGPWFHNLHLPDGVQTCPEHWAGDFPRWKWLEFEGHLPGDLTGWRALDIGCNAGFYSFELGKRRAEVLGIDIDPHYLAQARWAAERFGLRNVRFARRQLYELDPTDRFDLILFMGLFYHLRYPLLALDLLARLRKCTPKRRRTVTSPPATASPFPTGWGSGTAPNRPSCSRAVWPRSRPPSGRSCARATCSCTASRCTAAPSSSCTTSCRSSASGPRGSAPAPPVVR